MPERFYVYKVLDTEGAVIYVGKGSGKRYLSSMTKRGGASSEIVERFSSEAAAYRAEVAYIKQLCPTMNLCVGGNGPRSRRATRKPAWLVEMESIGTQVYAARLALKYWPLIDRSKLDSLRRVACGARA